MPYGTSKYGSDVYATTLEHPYHEVTGKVMWVVQVDWGRDGSFSQPAEPQTISKLRIRRGRTKRVRSDNTGQLQPGQETFEIEIRDTAGRYDAFNTGGPLYSFLGILSMQMRVFMVSTTSKTPAEPVFYGTLEQVTYDAQLHKAVLSGQGMARWLRNGNEMQQVFTQCQMDSGGWDSWFVLGGGTPFPVNHWKGRTGGLYLSQCVALLLAKAGWDYGYSINTFLGNYEQPDYFYMDGLSAWDQLVRLADGFAARLFFLRDAEIFVMDRLDGVAKGTAAAPTRALERYGLDRSGGLDNLRNVIEVAVRPHSVPLFDTTALASYLMAWDNAGPIAVPPKATGASVSSVEMDVEYFHEGQPFQGSFVRINSDDPAEISPMAIWSSPDKTGTNMGSTGAGLADAFILFDHPEPGRSVPKGDVQQRTRIQLNNYSPTLTAYFFNVRVEVAGIQQPGTSALVSYTDAASLALNGRRVLKLDNLWIQDSVFAGNIAQAYGQALVSREAAVPGGIVYQWSGQTLYDNLKAYDVGTIIDFGAAGGADSLANFGLVGRWLIVGQEISWLSADGQDALVKLTYEKVTDDTPGLVYGLQVWLDASYLSGVADGASVSSWTDRSGKGNHAIQGTAGNKPIYRSTGAPGGKPAIEFDNTDDYLTLTNPLTVTQSTYFIVYKINAAGSTNNCLLTETDAIYHYLQYTSDWYNTASAVVGGVTTTPGTFYLRSCVNATSNVKRYANGIAQTVKARTAADAKYKYLGLPGFVCNSTIAEIIIYNEALTDADRTAVENYLKAKYGLA